MKANEEWKPFFEIMRNAEYQVHTSLEGNNLRKKDNLVIKKFLDGVPKKLRCIYECALAVAKWHPDNDTRGGYMWATCAFCINYLSKIGEAEVKKCSKRCPLKKVGKGCLDVTPSKKSLFITWMDYPGNKEADAMYYALLQIYAEEWKRLKSKGVIQ